MPPQYTWYQGEVLDIRNESPNVKLFEFKLHGLDHFSYKAGQFVQVDLPIDCPVTRRSYSISSAPNGSNHFQLCIVLNPEGLGTPYLFDQVKVGNIFPVSEPLGYFTFPEPMEKELCFVSTGVGIAPFRAMLLDAVKRNLITHKVTMFFGNRHEHDILYRKEFEKIAEENPNFKFVPILSRSPGWGGCEGRVHEWYLKEFADGRPCKFYLCGWREMINEARKNLASLGYKPADIKFELYT